MNTLNDAPGQPENPIIPPISEEIDEPQPDSKSLINLHYQMLTEGQVRSLEEQKFEHGKTIDKWAIGLLIGCIVALVAVYIFEIFVTIKWDVSDFVASFSITEILRALIFSLIGFLFAKRTI